MRVSTAMDSKPASKGRVAVIGGGISGLVAAWNLTKAGYDVDVFDAASRMGGKIQTLQFGNHQVADVAAEFVDSDQQSLIDLCKELNVPLIPALDSLESTYYLPNGKVYSEQQFSKAYLPLSQQIMRDKAEVFAYPNGELAQYLDSISLSQYYQELNAGLKDERPWWKRTLLFWQKKPGVDPNVIKAAEQGYAGEHGRPASAISALQFVHESGDTENLIHSDCQYRIGNDDGMDGAGGGTGRLINALQQALEEKGARFHTSAKATGITRQDGRFNITFEKQPDARQGYDQVVLATQAHNLPQIKGLDALGLSADDMDTLQNLQYTYNTKINVGTRVPVKNDGFFISRLGYQAWSRAPGEVVFLIGDDLPAKYKPKTLMNLVLNDYAKAHGTTADKLFDTTALNYNGPDVDKPCYVTPAPGQSLRLRQVAKSFDRMAEQGIGVVGTYIPRATGGGVGYMGDGVDSANRATQIMVSSAQARSKARTQVPERDVAMTDDQPHDGHAGHTAPPTSGSGRRLPPARS